MFYQLYLAYYYKHQFDGIVPRERTMIVGNIYAILGLITIMYDYDCNLKLVCIIDNNEEVYGRKVLGIPVYGPVERIPELCSKLEIENIVFVSSSYDSDLRQKILSLCSKTNCYIKPLPLIYDTIKDQGFIREQR